MDVLCIGGDLLGRGRVEELGLHLAVLHHAEHVSQNGGMHGQTWIQGGRRMEGREEGEGGRKKEGEGGMEGGREGGR